ncbi:DNA topoisomerase 3 [Pasteurella atlantica]|uniref:type IA DNA topoisomerase n=1 Tax=Phocoenobacter atlanticus TaxID=3416742 RepID=UPI0027479080|nr:type IA DNA topoisomerase [Pasteurella atlantica]MDP8042522.1 DNA topoisomerase 3 [Pasteurella atlantica]
MKLVIAEKPQLGMVIANALGIISRKNGYIECKGSYTVTWAIGHILQLKDPKEYNPSYQDWKKDDLPLKLRPLELEPKKDTQNQFNIVKSLLNNANLVVNAGDPDDEGQLLIDEILDYCNFKGEVKRVLINDLNVESARKSMQNLKDNADFIGMKNKALARSHADFIYGINMTRAYTLSARAKGLTGTYAVGRVQTPTLGLIVRRYLDNKNHKESYYYNLLSDFENNGEIINTRLIITDNIEIDPNNEKEKRIIDENIVESIKNACLNGVGTIKNCEIQSKTTQPQLPFSLLDLQARVNNKYGLSSDDTLQITQALREKHKAITYNRSDCRYLSEEQFLDAPQTLDFIKSNFDDLPFQKVDYSKKSRAFNDKKITAHTGIIPVKSNFKLADLSKKEQQVYREIVEQYVIQFMPEKKYNIASIDINCNDYEFRATASKIIDYGWSNLVTDTESNDAEDNSNYELISSFENKSDINFTCKDIQIKKEKTKPLPIYTDATLLKDLQRVAKYISDPDLKALLIEKDKGRDGENGGIGTPATRSAIIKNLHKQQYFIYDGKKIVPTQKAIDFINALPQILTVPDTTALWFEQQTEIEQGKISVDDFLNGIDNFVAEHIKLADNIKLELKGDPCPKCNKGVLVLRKTKDGSNSFYSCSCYPDCNYISSTLGGEAIPPCPCCGKKLFVNQKAVSCEDRDCLTIWREVAGKKITDNQILSILTKGKSGLIKGFKSKAGKEFNARLILDKKAKKINLEF